MDQYSELNDYDSTLSETFNAWLELFVPCTRHMLPATFDVYIILLSVLWNERVVARRSSCPAASSQPAAAAMASRSSSGHGAGLDMILLTQTSV